ncbi:hypothetical protein Pint_16181 [Pistacia integerrima]|uniref:Uncharacterized protein n=1 Tax=Pistacia integerrima TaxID=434235 RepID=A0ACC0ZG03_9ROSI|nr:hypothetical protein Pint_16181 [Pistacia integerrima]
MVEFLLFIKFMDERDTTVREKLNSVKDTSKKVKGVARDKISITLSKMKKQTKLEERKKVESELQEVLANLEKQKEDTIKSLDSQIVAFSQEIVNKVLLIQ